MANAFKDQSLVEKAVAVRWKALDGIIDHINWDNSLVSGKRNTGFSTTKRRASRVRSTITSTGTSYALPGTTQPAISYSDLSDAVVPINVTNRIEANIQASMEELTFHLDRNDVVDRFIDPMIVSIKDQVNLHLAQMVSQMQGATVVKGTAYSNYAQDFQAALGSARALGIQRGGFKGSEEKLLLAHMGVMPQVGPSAATVYHYGDGLERAQANGTPQQSLAGFRLYESPLLPKATAPAQPGSLSVAAPSGTVTNGVASGYATTFQVNLANAAASTTYKAGTILAFTGVNWIVPTTQQDTGVQATFVLTADATSDSSGNVTVTLAEALIYGGDMRNTTLTTAIPTSTTVSIIKAGATQQPSFAFVKDAILGSSVDIMLPKGVPFAKSYNFKGFQFALIEDRWPGTLQNIIKVVGFYGVTVLMPEGVIQIL